MPVSRNPPPNRGRETTEETPPEETPPETTAEAPRNDVDAVAMVSRNFDGSDAQPNRTVRILDDEDSAKADEAQADANDQTS